jgi:hypothetical protein
MMLMHCFFLEGVAFGEAELLVLSWYRYKELTSPAYQLEMCTYILSCSVCAICVLPCFQLHCLGLVKFKINPNKHIVKDVNI